MELGVNSIGLKVLILNINKMDQTRNMTYKCLMPENTASARMKLHGAFKIQLNRKFS